jgi:prepilin-type N-terminal cleavage/methylation domain-containing protein
MLTDTGEDHLNLRFRNQVIGEKGFTLIELIATLVIISVLAAVVVPRYLDAETSAKMRGLDLGISEMNGRETLTWAMVKLSDLGYPAVDGDILLWDQLVVDPGTDLGADYDWTGIPSRTGGGTLRFKKEVSAAFTRSPSNREKPGKWSR